MQTIAAFTTSLPYPSRKAAKAAAKAEGHTLEGQTPVPFKVEGEWLYRYDNLLEQNEDTVEQDVTTPVEVEQVEDTEEPSDTEQPEVEQPETEVEQNEDTGLTEEEVEAARTELAALRVRVAELEGILATEQVHVLVTSTVKGPVSLVREIFLAMVGTGAARKDVLAKCVAAGVAPNTAKTQYQILKGKFERGELAEELAELAAEQE